MNIPLHASSQHSFFTTTHKMETEVQAPTVPKFFRYRSVRNALCGRETKVPPPLPQYPPWPEFSPQSEDPPQEKPRHGHVQRPVESSAETHVHHHRHQSRRVRAIAVDSTGTRQLHSPSGEPKDIATGVPASSSLATKPIVLPPVSIFIEWVSLYQVKLLTNGFSIGCSLQSSISITQYHHRRETQSTSLFA